MTIYNIETAKQDYLNQFYQTLLAILESSGSGTGIGDISAPRLSLIGETLVKIDELMPQAEGIQFNLTGADNSNVIQLYVNSLMDEAAKHLLQIVPIHRLNATDGSAIATQHTAGSEVGFIYLPTDYLRFVSFKITGWLQEVTAPITTLDPKYILQKYRASRGGIAKPIVAINSATKTNAPVAQIDQVALVGSSGTLQISGPGGLVRSAAFNTTPTQTAIDFVAAYAADYTAKGITLTRSVEKLIFTAAVAGTGFDHPVLLTIEGDLSGVITRTQANVPTKEAVHILEYYSDPTKNHALEKFQYIALVGAEYIQSNLHDALTWLCASKVLQIWGENGGSTSYAEKALQQVELSLKNLL